VLKPVNENRHLTHRFGNRRLQRLHEPPVVTPLLLNNAVDTNDKTFRHLSQCEVLSVSVVVCRNKLLLPCFCNSKDYCLGCVV